jgi:DNA polymerase-3 subunit epsilon
LNNSEISIYDAAYIVCDIETTGLSPITNRITEISLIKVKDGEISDRFTSLINPRQHIPQFITQLTGIKNEDVVNKPTFEQISDNILSFFKDEDYPIVFVGHNVAFDYKFIRESFLRMDSPVDFQYDTLCTCKLARRLLRNLKSKSLGNVAKHFGFVQNRKHRAYDDTLVTAKILMKFLDELHNDFEYDELKEVLKFQNSKIYTTEKKSPALKRIGFELKNLPESPGVYFFKSRHDEILYIGKAKNLKERVSTYFHHNSELPYKIRRLLASMRKFDYQTTDSELSALILESKLIKHHKPRFNTAIKRFRFHPFIKLDVQNDFPKIQNVYEIENDGAYYYGPFSSRVTVRNILKDINSNFLLRKCEDKYLKASETNSNCMYYDIGQCEAPCNVSVSREKYREEVEKVHSYITGINGKSVQDNLRQIMEEHSQNLDFENAAFARDILKDIMKVMSYQKVITSAINDRKIIIKLDSKAKREIFFVHNGKLINTHTISKDNEFDQSNYIEELSENAEYLYFSLNKFSRHQFTTEELDEIKVISNWLALNRDRNKVLEIDDSNSKDDILKFIFN